MGADDDCGFIVAGMSSNVTRVEPFQISSAVGSIALIGFWLFDQVEKQLYDSVRTLNTMDNSVGNNINVDSEDQAS